MSLFGWPNVLNLGCSVAIVIQSFAARFGFIQLTKLIHFTSISQRMRVIIVSVFAIFYVNYGLIYMIAPFRLNLGFVSTFMVGIYEDFNQFWFSDIGNMVISTMLINAVTAPLEALGLWFW